MSLFKAPQAPKLPKIACIGTVTAIAETKASASGQYNVTNITIEPIGGGINARLSLLTRPEWLAPNYNPDVALDGQKGPKFVYSTNIAGPSGAPIGRLLGLAGSEEAADTLAQKIFAAVSTTKDEDGNDVSYVPDAKLDEVLQTLVGTTVGYVMTQKLEQTEEVDEAGKKIRVRTNNYEFGEFFYPTEKALAKYRKLATEKSEDWRVGFDQ